MSIKLRKRQGWYHADIHMDGKRFRRALDTRDLATARLKARHLTADLSPQMILDRISLADFVTEYLAWGESRKFRLTMATEKQRLMKLAEHFGASTKLDDITFAKADAWITSLRRDDGLASATVNGFIRIARAAFNRARKLKYIAENPFNEVQLLSVDYEEPRIIRGDELQKFFAACPAQLAGVFLFSLLTGLRRSEMCRLEWSDVETTFIVVRRAKAKRGRRVPLPQPAIVILQQRRANSKPFDFHPSTLSHYFKRFAKDAGVPDISLHDLRRTYGTMLAEKGVSDALIRKWMGHSRKETFDTHYLGMPDSAFELVQNVPSLATVTVNHSQSPSQNRHSKEKGAQKRPKQYRRKESNLRPPDPQSPQNVAACENFAGYQISTTVTLPFEPIAPVFVAIPSQQKTD